MTRQPGSWLAGVLGRVLATALGGQTLQYAVHHAGQRVLRLARIKPSRFLHGAIVRVTVDMSPILTQAITARSQGVRDSATASPTVAAMMAISTAASRQKAQALPASSAGSVERRCHQPIPT